MLGPLEVRRDGQPCTPTALKRRALLALLLLHANEPLSVTVLIDELWDCHPPRSATATLQMYVSGLRHTLDPDHRFAGRDPRQHPVLRTEGSGYRLRARPGELDLDHFQALAGLGRSQLQSGRCAVAARASAARWRSGGGRRSAISVRPRCPRTTGSGWRRSGSRWCTTGSVRTSARAAVAK